MSTFETLHEARAAFLLEQLEFRRADRAYVVFLSRTGKPEGHELVTVTGVSAINGQGQPVYTCKRKGGANGEYDASQLHKDQNELLYDEKGELNAYGKWFFEQQVEMRDNALRRPMPPVDVTLGIYQKSVNPFAGTSSHLVSDA